MANASDTSVTGKSLCANVSVDEALEQQCNLSPCQVYTWDVGNWSSCNTTCGGKALALEALDCMYAVQ